MARLREVRSARESGHARDEGTANATVQHAVRERRDGGEKGI